MVISAHPDRRLVVELGCDAKPVGVRHGQRIIRPADDYICIDTFDGNDDYCHETQQLLRAHRRFKDANGHWVALRGDAADMKLPGSVVDLILAVNFFGDPSTWRKHEAVAREIARVLKTTGTATIVESQPPRIITLGHMVELMGQHDLHLASGPDPYNVDNIDRYADDAHTDHDSFAANFVFPDHFQREVISVSQPGPDDDLGSIDDGLEGEESLGGVTRGVAFVIGMLTSAGSAAASAAEQTTAARHRVLAATAGSSNRHVITIQTGLKTAAELLEVNSQLLAETAADLGEYIVRVTGGSPPVA